MTLILKRAETTPIKITIDIDTDAGKLSGTFTGHAKVRSKADNKKLLDRIVEAAQKDEDADADSALVREIYDRFEGLGNESGALEGEAAFAEVLDGQYSGYLTTAVIQSYYAHYAEARQGNSPRRRWR